jgi:hypothetical protein
VFAERGDMRVEFPMAPVEKLHLVAGCPAQYGAQIVRLRVRARYGGIGRKIAGEI